MAKKRKRPTTPDRDPPTQFRAGDKITQWLQAFGEERGLPSNEVAKRLVLLSRNGMDARYHDAVAELAQSMSDKDAGFPDACVEIYVSLRNEEHALDARSEKMSAEQRHATIVEAIQSNIRRYKVARGIPEVGEQQEQPIQIRQNLY